ncbi:24832_t:CDS:10 [Entrophospora sp. SA101]|nr:7051_t:CDS:10 [Entrophospora sp. SA101]CAJ0649339.1 13768_t:CDS:10 [Entrophospora sp. SA101]CAJ0753649.1 24832_t:CDS:10 [Entrophospora sp. SA101]CAJ0842484.1 110_t:CDS:10 [Entrophospora sp. SA101]CAJ0895466.1 10454_t:CDS:10 [Entrophospora sp. SA101]
MEEVSYKFLRGKSVGVIGCPFSGGQPKDGVDEGPLKIIEYGLIEQLQEMDWDVEFDGHLKLTDLKPKDDPNIGKLKRPRYVSRVTEAVSRSVERHHRKGQMVLTLGGDHSLALGTVSGTLAVHHDACLIWIDAHADINTPESTDSGNLHGCPVSFLLGIAGKMEGFEWIKPRLTPDRLVYIGLRDIDQPEKKILKQHVNPDRNRPIHLSFDVDALDPTVAPSTGTPVRGGLTFREGHYICEAIHETGLLVAVDLMEEEGESSASAFNHLNNNNSHNNNDEAFFDNELTLTPDELFKIINSNNNLNYNRCIDPNTNNYVNIKKPSIPKPKNCIEYLKWSNFLNHLLIPIYHDIALKLTWPMTKKVLKAAVAYWLAFLIVLTVPVMKTIGTGTFLAIVMVCYFQPSGTFGSLVESAGWGIIGACIATLWSYVGIKISDAIRGDEIFNIGSTIISLLFLAIGTFILSYDKIKWPPMRYGSINACIIMTFSLTQSYIKPQDTNNILKTLVIPMLIGPACSLIVNISLWPENATTNYIPYLHATLQSFIHLLEHETHFFLCDPYNRNTIAMFHRQAQDNLLNLDTAKREAQHEISFSKIGPQDLIEINRLVKSMHMTLGGLALSGVIEEELMKDGQEAPTSSANTTGSEEDLDKLLDIFKQICSELSETCQLCLADCVSRVDHLRHNCSSPWYYRWLPFGNNSAISHKTSPLNDPLEYLRSAIRNYQQARRIYLDRLFSETPTISPSPQRVLLLLMFFENDLMVFAESLGSLVGLIKVLETSRHFKKLWMPPIPLLKRMHNVGEINEDGWRIFETQSRREQEEELGMEFYDPDVTLPTTKIQKLWYNLWRIRNWFDSKYARYAFKNTIVVTALGIPAFLPYSYEWFDNYRGQWAIISAVLSFSPTTGGAVLQLVGRLLGSVVGASMAIIAWMITGGNTYGLATVLFLFSLLLWFVYLNAKVWTVGGVIMLVNFALVLANAYQASMGVGMHDDVLVVAKKRTSAVIVGITAAFIMTMFPWPHAGRVEVRHRLAHTITDIGVLYSMTVSSLLKETKSNSLSTTKPFRKLVSRINRSIGIARLLLSRTVYEPPLRGNYPEEKYKRMIDIVENMLNLVCGIEHELLSLNGTEWKTDLADVLSPAKCHYVTHILTAFHILGTALENRVSLPPYNIVASGDAKFGLAGKISYKISRTASGLSKHNFETPAYACYCAYLIKSSHLINELMKLVGVVKSLVGVNRYVKELIDF